MAVCLSVIRFVELRCGNLALKEDDILLSAEMINLLRERPFITSVSRHLCATYRACVITVKTIERVKDHGNTEKRFEGVIVTRVDI